jgi:hypothetical protein
VFGMVALVTVVSAQTLPLPTLPPEQPPDVGPATPGEEEPGTEARASGTGRPLRWEYGLGVGAGYDSNINFRVPDGPSSWAVSPRGSLARVFTSLRGALRLGATGSWYGYAQERDLSRYYASVGLDGSHRPSLSTTWRASASYALGYTDSSRILSDQGVLLPLVRTRTAAGALGVIRTLGLRTSLRFDGRIYHTEFDQQDAAALRLVDGQSLRGTAGLVRSVGLRDALTVEYSLEMALSRPSPETAERDERRYYQTHFGSLQWNHVLSPRSGFMLEAGASYTPDAAQAGLGRRESFFGGASYSRQARRSSFTIFARREVTPAFGIGVSRIVNRFGFDATIPMGRAWALHIDGTRVLPETPEGATFTYGTRDDVSVSLARRLGRHFDVSSEGRYRRREATGDFPDLEAYQVGVFLSLVGSRGGSGSRFGR